MRRTALIIVGEQSEASRRASDEDVRQVRAGQFVAGDSARVPDLGFAGRDRARKVLADLVRDRVHHKRLAEVRRHPQLQPVDRLRA